jgi:signal transduction histidine kinase
LSEDIIDLREASDTREKPNDVVDLRELVSGVVDRLDALEEVRIDIQPGVVVQVDRLRLERVLTNFVSNALQHGKHDIRVEHRSLGDHHQVEVWDRGPGVPGHALPHLFERFYQADPSRSGGGAGLGLAIAAECAASAGFSLSVSSSPEGGTCFVVTLPRLEASDGPARSSADIDVMKLSS